jgi:hypothetical protein
MIRMRKRLKIIMMTAMMLMAVISTALADDPTPPDPGGDPTTGGGTPVGAPIDGGLGILLALGASYGGMKLYKYKKKSQEEVA